jgi:hypothetical protein
MIALGIFEENDRAVCRHEEVARRIAQEVAEHVSRSGRVSLIIGVKQQHRAVFRPFHPIAKSDEPLTPKPHCIDRGRLGVRQPHSVRCGVGCRVTHPVRKVDVVDIVGVKRNDAHLRHPICRSPVSIAMLRNPQPRQCAELIAECAAMAVVPCSACFRRSS